MDPFNRIRFAVVCWGHGRLDSETLVDRLEQFTREVGSLVRVNFLGYSKSTKDVVHKDFGHGFGAGIFGGKCLYPSCKTVADRQDVGVAL